MTDPPRREPPILVEAEFTDATRYFVTQAAIICTVTVVLIPVLPIVVGITYIVKRKEYGHIRCYLTPRFLKVHRGWLNKVEKTIPLDKVTDLGVNQGLLMRWVGVETLQVETAGQSGPGGALVNLVGVKDARAFRDRVLDQRDALVEREERQAGEAAEAAAPADGDTLREVRDILLRIESKLDR